MEQYTELLEEFSLPTVSKIVENLVYLASWIFEAKESWSEYQQLTLNLQLDKFVMKVLSQLLCPLC